MATITIENVPEKTVAKFGTRVSFSSISLTKKKNDPTLALQSLIQESENTSSDFMSWEDFLKEMKTW